MKRFICYATTILCLLTLPITLFYSPNLPTYVLGDIREGIVGGWVLSNSFVGLGLGILAIVLFKVEKFNGWTISILMFLLIGSVLLHGIPSMVYWDYIQSGNIINDDTGIPSARASFPIFVWHVLIVINSITIIAVKIINAIQRRLPGNIT